MTITPLRKDDYACLHEDYRSDPDLAIIADTLTSEHAAGYLVWLYWPGMIAAAKKAKSFGWFRTTPKQIAASLDDPISGAWQARSRMWDLLVEQERITVRQGGVESASQRVDVLLNNWPAWQSMTSSERKKLQRAREAVGSGQEPHWTVHHLDEFKVFAVATADVSIRTAVSRPVTDIRDAVTGSRDAGTDSRDSVTACHDTRLDKTRQGQEHLSEVDDLAPPTELDKKIQGCWEWYCNLFGKTGRSELKLSKKRRGRIKWALKAYSSEQVAECIRGYHADPWRHEDLSRHDIAVLLRDEQSVEAGIAKSIAAENVAAASSNPVAASILEENNRLLAAQQAVAS